ncbi:hypothetical protein PIROE2DRAFT_14117 [Piromyces sp. E2]|nr:hypothetical protein PIROE2DRAFT_14117 [Piromyces sp. E2]|eukprot:OUM60192.1 hypothetical protein PIROE2DRAFT_14117 [Piromyces sp. E2]
MNNIIFLVVLLLSFAKYSIQDCCYTSKIVGDGQVSYLCDIVVKPAAKEVQITYYDPYNVNQIDPFCQIGTDTNTRIVCNGSSQAGSFQTRLVFQDSAGSFINSVDLDVRADGMRCTKGYDNSCGDNGKIVNQNPNDYCLGFLGCYPKMACYIALIVFVICIAGIVVAIIRRNSGSGEKAALDRPNTKREHLDDRPDPISNYNTTTNKETLIQIDDMPLDFKEAGTTNWVNKKYNSGGKDLGLGLGSGSGGFGSRSSLLPTSNVTVINDPNAGLNRGRSVKRTQSTRSTKKPRSNDPNHLNAPPLPNGSPLYSSSNLNRNKSTRSVKSTKSVKSSKSIRKPKPSDGSLGTSLTSKKSIRNQHQPSQKRYQIPSDSESDSDSDNEVLGLRAKQPSMKRVNNGSGSLPRKNYHSTSVKGKASRY